jgi:hypothetical protein
VNRLLRVLHDYSACREIRVDEEDVLEKIVPSGCKATLVRRCELDSLKRSYPSAA